MDGWDFFRHENSVSNFDAGIWKHIPPLLSIEIVSRRIEFVFTCIIRLCYRLNAGTESFLVFQSLKALVVILVLSWCVDGPLFVDLLAVCEMSRFHYQISPYLQQET